MKSWKMRLGLVLTVLAMVLVISIPAVADNDRDCINRDGDRFCEVNGDGNGDNDRDNIEDFCDDNGDDGDEEDCDFGFLDGSDFEIGDVQLVCGDNDGDGSVDEDAVDGLDNDLDGLLDEDENLFECNNPLLVAELDFDD